MRFNFKGGLHDKEHNSIKCEEVYKMGFAICSIKTYF